MKQEFSLIGKTYHPNLLRGNFISGGVRMEISHLFQLHEPKVHQFSSCAGTISLNTKASELILEGCKCHMWRRPHSSLWINKRQKTCTSVGEIQNPQWSKIFIMSKIKTHSNWARFLAHVIIVVNGMYLPLPFNGTPPAPLLNLY